MEIRKKVLESPVKGLRAEEMEGEGVEVVEGFDTSALGLEGMLKITRVVRDVPMLGTVDKWVVSVHDEKVEWWRDGADELIEELRYLIRLVRWMKKRRG